ncbi:hypothetical protein [Sinorhizobium meliloti]|uniref:hypothetical protein n=1 Tax=Rhizobium meliloti TaxID=382 RepID=UPI000FD44067|nr:hypothetical protein [Sinorhizobium meliloti]MCM5689295.1 hypothetical protein [Sinorhizobium meliloti]RVN85097.1 hypothetical protein CN101_23500 [Sinorhizobium meliloti]RVO54364.1 hypothetical protein CN094_26855 [Sinorhizobium meliloti]
MTITTTAPRGRSFNERPSNEIEAAIAAWNDEEVAKEIASFRSDSPRRLYVEWFPLAMNEATRRGIPINLGL